MMAPSCTRLGMDAPRGTETEHVDSRRDRPGGQGTGRCCAKFKLSAFAKSSCPPCTIQAAANARHGAGVVLKVKPHTYQKRVNVPDNGAAGSPYMFQAQGTGVIVTGSPEVFFSPSAVPT